MEMLQGILALVALVAIVYFMREAKFAAMRAVNQKVLFRDKHETGQQIVNEPIEFNTTASASDIVRALATHVTTTDELPIGFAAAVYQKDISEKKIVYACGNKLSPTLFVAMVAYVKNGEKTYCRFQIINWKLNSGMIVAQEAMQKLRKEVQAAFDSIEGQTTKTGAGEKVQGNFCESCHAENIVSAKFCKQCGKQI